MYYYGMAYHKPTPEQITAWVAKHFDYKVRKQGVWLLINNPFDGDTGYNFNISTTEAFVNDWRGNQWAPISQRTGKRKRGFIKFVQLYLNCSYQSAVKSICEAAGSQVPRFSLEPEKISESEPPLVDLPAGVEFILDSKQKKAAELVLRWLKSRGIDREIIEEQRIHHLGTDVVWPYYEYERLVYYQSRSMLNKRFLFPDQAKFGVSKGQFLYNFDHVEPANFLVITEAIFDCLTLRKQAVASGGADLTVEQIKKIRLLRPKEGIILAPDNDGAGLKSIINNARALPSWDYQICYSVPPESYNGKPVKDWNELWQVGCRDVFKLMSSNIRLIVEKGGQTAPREMIALNNRLAETSNKKKLISFCRN